MSNEKQTYFFENNFSPKAYGINFTASKKY